jgi:hypothetical protein
VPTAGLPSTASPQSIGAMGCEGFGFPGGRCDKIRLIYTRGRMKKLQIEVCQLCGMNLSQTAVPSTTGEFTCACRRCGTYKITWPAYRSIPKQQPFLASAARQASELGRPITFTPENWQGTIAEHDSTGIAENMDKLPKPRLEKVSAPSPKHHDGYFLGLSCHRYSER